MYYKTNVPGILMEITVVFKKGGSSSRYFASVSSFSCIKKCDNGKTYDFAVFRKDSGADGFYLPLSKCKRRGKKLERNANEYISSNDVIELCEKILYRNSGVFLTGECSEDMCDLIDDYSEDFKND